MSNKPLELTGEYLEKQVSEYAKEKEIDEGKLWEELNNEFKMIYGTNQQLAKEEYQKENNIVWLDMAEWLYQNKQLEPMLFVFNRYRNKEGYL